MPAAVTNPPTKAKISQKAMFAAKEAAIKTVSKAVLCYMTQPSKRSWAAISKHIGVEIPSSLIDGQICSKDNIQNLWGSWYINSTVKRVSEAFASADKPIEVKKADVARASDIKDSDCYDLGWTRLKREQQAAFEAIYRELFEAEKPRPAVMQDGNTGAGKMIIGCAVIHKLLTKRPWDKPGSFYMHPIMVFCPKNVQEAWYRKLEESGMGKYIGNDVVVIPYSQLSATYGDVLVSQELDPYDENKPPTYKWNRAMMPYFALFDECHKLANEGTTQTKAILAMTLAPAPAIRPRSLWMSATPGVTINNMKAFTCSTNYYVDSLGIHVNPNNWAMFAGLLTNEPARPNIEAVKRWRKMLAPYIISLPRVKWDHRAINSVILVDFLSEQDIAIYQNSYERYREKLHALGKQECKNAKFLQFVAFNQFRKGVEPIRMVQIVDRCHKHIQSGDVSPVIGLVYLDSLIKAVFRLTQLGYKREDISLIYGGRRQIKESFVLTADEFKDLLQRIATGYEPTKDDMKRLEETLAFKETKLSYQESSDEETHSRLQKLREFGLTGVQSPNQRQVEIDRFQSGESKICIFTLAAGGIGLSLDHCTPNLLPRVGYFTPTYSGPEFKQALGRLERRMTLSDTYQYIVGMRGTIEESHVMPLIDKKLRCIATITNADNEIINFHNAKVTDLRIRTIAEAEAEDNEDSRTENIQTEIEDLDDNED